MTFEELLEEFEILLEVAKEMFFGDAEANEAWRAINRAAEVYDHALIQVDG